MIFSIGLASYLTSLDSIVDSNFSIIGNNLQYRLTFIIWGLFTNYFLFSFLKVFEKAFNLYLALISGLLVVFLPYQPLSYPIIANLHILMGFISFALYNYLIYKTLVKQNFINYQITNKLLIIFNLLLLFEAFLVAYYMHINSLIELTYNIVMFNLLTYLYWKIC